jgi:ribonucleoside-diphosphate reductase alpha chain
MSKYQEISLSPNALSVLERRYLAKDSHGRVIETPRDLFIRVAKCIAEADRNYGVDESQIERLAEQFYDLMALGKFMPNSPTLMNAGRPLGQLSACFVLPVGDSMEEIFETNKQAALIHKSGGGTGFSFSRLRPKNSVVASTSGVASGPVSFMKVYDSSTEAVRQGGTRRGANMGILRVDHPDIRDFIACKDDTSAITNFNISVAITDEFMAALKENRDYAIINPRTNAAHTIDSKEVRFSAKEIFDDIVNHAWSTGEPGIVFIDRMNQRNPTFPSETIEATNPCGEQPLPPYDSCNLASINLGKFVKTESPASALFNPEEGIDWTALGKAVRLGVHFLDNVIDQNKYPLPEIEIQTKKNRRIGLGVMGFADMLVQLRLPYNHEQAFALAERIMGYISEEARNESSELAKSRGKFPNWELSVYAKEQVSLRNATATTIAPTGTISIIANCSSGIEPYYAIAFERNVMDGTRLTEINPYFANAARERGFYSEELIEQVLRVRSLAEIRSIPDDVKAVFLTAADISPEDHVRMQAIFQKYCDSSVSKTINFQEKATPEDVRRAFVLAYELGCKGVTIYRDNSRPNQVLSNKSTPAISGVVHAVTARPSQLGGFTEKIRTGYGNLYVTVNSLEGKPFEVFAHIGHSGYTTMADTEGICRLISLALRSGIPVEQIIKQLRGIGGSSPAFSNGAKVWSIPDAIAQVLARHWGTLESGAQSGVSEICPSCAGAMRFDSGCFSCPSCGYSTC